jgi:tetratricopeptide (TPR) repeat protein
MLKTRIILIVSSAIVIWLLFLLPKVVVDNKEKDITNQPATSQEQPEKSDIHVKAPQKLLDHISKLRQNYKGTGRNEKNAIFADSLTTLYAEAGKFDSAAWFAEEASKFFNTVESWVKAGDNYYQAYTFALDEAKQNALAAKTQAFYEKVLKEQPKNLDVKTRMAMTYMTSKSPMQGIMMLREVLAEDPKNVSALFNLGMLSVQSGQYDKAIDRLQELVKINPAHTQGQLLLGIALMKKGDKTEAKKQFQKVKDMDKDPSVQATADSYLKDLN